MPTPAPNFRTLTPHLVIEGASDAIEYYKRAFGAIEITRMAMKDGKTLMHAAVQIGDSYLMLADAAPAWGVSGPKALKGTPVTIHLSIPNVDEVFERAIAAGAKVLMPPTDMFWGDRYGKLEDPFGHHWGISSKIKEMSLEEMNAAGEAFAAQMS
jgi:uncharacterized glyoxalase superfamily protein PhnB